MAKKVTRQWLRDRWNDVLYQSALWARTTQQVRVYEGLAPPEANQEPGTISAVDELYDNRVTPHELLAALHYYRRPDGTIGASGKYDPTFLLVDGIPHVDP